MSNDSQYTIINKQQFTDNESRSYTMEKVIRILDDQNGERFELSQDSDGVFLLELRNYSTDNSIAQTFVMPIAVAKLIQKHMPEMISHIEDMEREDDAARAERMANNDAEGRLK